MRRGEYCKYFPLLDLEIEVRGWRRVMICERPKFAAATTLTETVVAMAILAIATLGGLGYQYHAARHGRIARAQIIGTRTAQLLLENWKGTGGSQEFDPTDLELGFSSELEIPSFLSEGAGTPLHNAVYAITVDNIQMLVMLKWRDVDYDSIAEITLRELSVAVRFIGNSELLNASIDPGNTSMNILPIVLTTYVRLDASSG